MLLDVDSILKILLLILRIEIKIGDIIRKWNMVKDVKVINLSKDIFYCLLNRKDKCYKVYVVVI